MGQRLSGCLRRHRRKLVIMTGVVGGVVILNSFMKRKFLKWQTEKSIECFEQLKKQSHFDSTLQTCDSAIVSFLYKIRETVSGKLGVDAIIEELKKKPSNKLELWNELKVMVFTQMVTEVYAHCLLVVLMRVQICIFGGYVYSNHHNNVPQIEKGNQEKYMSTISNFFVSGINQLTFPIEDSVRKVLKDVKLNDSLRLRDFDKIFQNIYYDISRGYNKIIPDVSQYVVFPDFENEDGTAYDPALQRIVNETKDILECEDFNRVLSYCVEHGMSTMLDRISECFMHLSSDCDQNQCQGTSTDASMNRFKNPNDVSAPLAKIIPALHNVVNSHRPSENDSLNRALLQNESLKAFSANLYEAFSHENFR